MRITTQLLKSVSTQPLHEVEYLDLSGEEIVAIERLTPCRLLHSLNLHNNSIDSVHNVDCCRQLWHIDLTGNKVKSLHGLSRFPVLGMLSLGFNSLDWPEVGSLSHIRLISLTLTGNSKLDSNPHYRKHVVELLPHLWALDGTLITAEERKKVAKFFSKSHSSGNPVRKKSLERVFVPSSLKNLMVTGVFGDESTQMMSQFPINYIHNIDMDKRRLKYLGRTLQQEMELRVKYTPPSATPPPVVPQLKSLLDHSQLDVEQCNMLLLLLLASLEYNLPPEVMRATLETAKLANIGDVSCVDMLSLPPDMMLHSSSLLLNAATLNRQENREGGLYDKLFQSLCYTRDKVHRKLLSRQAKRHTALPRKYSPLEEARFSQYRCLLASEVVHLMCLVPIFFETLETHHGLMKMVVTATKNPSVADTIGNIAWKVQARGGDVWEVYHDIASYLLQTTSENVATKRSPRRTRPSSHIHKATSQPHLIQTKAPPTGSVRALSAGAVSRRLRSRANFKGTPPTRGLREPELGDLVYISAEQSGTIVALPEPRVAVLKLSNKHGTSQSDAYLYADTNGLVWNRQRTCWTRESNFVADVSTVRLSPLSSPSPDHLPSHASSASLDSSVSTLRISTPELPQTSCHGARPHSQMSFISDDLQTIPSQEELAIDEAPPPSLSMRVDIAMSGSSGHLYEASRTEHQRSVLQQYIAESANERSQESSREATSIHHDVDATLARDELPGQDSHQTDCQFTRSSSLPSGGHGGFHVPTPQLQLSDVWEKNSSLPSSSLSSHKRAHSCHHSESQRQNSKVEAHMYPSFAVSPTPSPMLYTAPPTDRTFSTSISSLSLKSVMGQSQSAESAGDGYLPVAYDAWMPVQPGTQATKHTALSSSRLMAKRHPKVPPITKKTGSSHSHGNNTSVVLQQKPQAPQTRHRAPSHMSAYNSHAERSVGRYSYRPTRATTPTKSTRKLGDVRTMYIGGSSIG